MPKDLKLDKLQAISAKGGSLNANLAYTVFTDVNGTTIINMPSVNAQGTEGGSY